MASLMGTSNHKQWQRLHGEHEKAKTNWADEEKTDMGNGTSPRTEKTEKLVGKGIMLSSKAQTPREDLLSILEGVS